MLEKNYKLAKKKMKKTNFILMGILGGALVLLTACPVATTEKITNVRKESKIEEEHCKVEDGKKYFRQSATVKHPDLGESEYEAIQFAKAQMAENISINIKSVTDRYKKTRTIGGNTEFDKSVEGITRFRTEVNLSNVKVICSKAVRDKETGMYHRFVAIEMSKEAVINGIESKISKDDAMYQDYKRNEMRKILDSEL